LHFEFFTTKGSRMAESKTLSLIEHLTKLRKRLIVIVVAVVFGMGLAWNFSGAILDFVQQPLTGHTYLTGIKKQVYLQVKERAPALAGESGLTILSRLLEHLLNRAKIRAAKQPWQLEPPGPNQGAGGSS
jgi:Sec-independent protein translocase protein (TatC)